MHPRRPLICLLASVILCLLPLSASAQRVKGITDLSADELEVANGMCQKVLKDYFGGRVMAWYSTTYHYLPTSDEEFLPDLSKMKKLNTPIIVVSVTGIALAHRHDEVKRELKKRIAQLAASYRGKEYHILRSLVLVEPGGGGGSMHVSFDKITIIPYTVAIE